MAERIVRIVKVRFSDSHRRPEARAAVAAEAKAVFPTIPGVVSFRAGVPTDPEADVDVVLLVGFAQEEDIEPYRAHPIHVAFVEDTLKPRMERLEAVNVRLA